MRYAVEMPGRNRHHGSFTYGEVFQRYELDGPNELEWLASLLVMRFPRVTDVEVLLATPNR